MKNRSQHINETLQQIDRTYPVKTIEIVNTVSMLWIALELAIFNEREEAKSL